MFRKSMCLLLTLCIFNLSLVGCAGHPANPVDRYAPGDEKRSCAGLLSEISTIDGEVVTKQKEKGDRDFWNVILFIGGVFIIVPFFFMDCKNSQEAEIDALKARNKMLKSYFAEKGCSVADPNSGATSWHVD